MLPLRDSLYGTETHFQPQQSTRQTLSVMATWEPGEIMATNPPDRVAVALDAVERLMKIYRFERAIFLIGAAAGMVLLIYAAFLTLRGGDYDKESLGYFFGAGGAFATAGGYVLRLLNKSFALVRDIILGSVGGQGS